MDVQVTIDAVLEKLKAELGNLVYQLAVKEAIIEELKRAANTQTPAGSENE